MLPAQASDGVAASLHRATIAPHLRAQMASTDVPGAHVSWNGSAAAAGRSKQEDASHLEGWQGSSRQLAPQQGSHPEQRDGSKPDIDGALLESQSPASLQQLQQTQQGHSPQQDQQQSKSQVAIEAVEASIAEVYATSAASDALISSASMVGAKAGGIASQTSLNGRRVRGIVFDLETNGEMPYEACT